MVAHGWQRDYTGLCDLKIKSKLFIPSGFWNSTFQCFHPNQSVTLNLQVCITQHLRAAELLGRGPVPRVTDDTPW